MTGVPQRIENEDPMRLEPGPIATTDDLHQCVIVQRPRGVRWYLRGGIFGLIAAGVALAMGHWLGLFLLGLAGFATVWGCVLKSIRRELTLDLDGFRHRYPLSTFGYQWHEIEAPRVVRQRAHGIPIFRIVGFDLANGAKPKWYHQMAEIETAVMLSSNFGVEPEALADLMRAFRDRALADPAQTAD